MIIEVWQRIMMTSLCYEALISLEAEATWAVHLAKQAGCTIALIRRLGRRTDSRCPVKSESQGTTTWQ